MDLLIYPRTITRSDVFKIQLPRDIFLDNFPVLTVGERGPAMDTLSRTSSSRAPVPQKRIPPTMRFYKDNCLHNTSVSYTCLYAASVTSSGLRFLIIPPRCHSRQDPGRHNQPPEPTRSSPGGGETGKLRTPPGVSRGVLRRKAHTGNAQFRITRRIFSTVAPGLETVYCSGLMQRLPDAAVRVSWGVGKYRLNFILHKRLNALN
ncbi:hypothetical protein AG1IA_00936 [Rhizoctonia solani AG-1 IA]|uniref:Uncharacterized protein n=1 Tax=Thanatephorus cucumeris (strain AG1-IA) TaxID=983506 RepID=L8X8R5_THACA|nr:hypothetical protein AG1IA_00936 [Rhizoctonia solani AG-1 IA]